MEKLHSQKKTMGKIKLQILLPFLNKILLSGPPHSRNSLSSLPVHDFVAGQAERTKEESP